MKTTRLVLCLVCLGAAPVADALAGNKHGKHAAPSIMPSVPQMPKFMEAGSLSPRTIGPSVPTTKLPTFETPGGAPSLAPAAPAAAGAVTAPRAVKAHDKTGRELKDDFGERGRVQSRELDDGKDRDTHAKTLRLDRKDDRMTEGAVDARRKQAAAEGEDQGLAKQSEKESEQDATVVAKKDKRDLPSCR